MSGSRARRLLTIAVLGIAGACQPLDRPHLGADLERGLAQGREFAADVIARGRSAAQPPPDEAVIALGYLERLRLGMGSPFRLVDQALRDPRLDDDTRRRLGWALLGRTLAGQTYEIDAISLDRAGASGVGSLRGIGRHHLELIEGAVAESRDPRGGELAVRLAYALAAAEGSVSRRASGLAAQAAALFRDREVARADALELLQEAERTRADPFALVPAWRADRRFRVEAPPKAVLPSRIELDAVELAPRLATAIRMFSPRAGGSLRPVLAAPPLLGQAAAARLAELTEAFDPPPQAPVVVAVGVHRRELLEQPGLAPAQLDARRRFVGRARHEEALVAEYAVLHHAEGGASAAAPLTALWAAAAMRAWAQEDVWFPGFGGPSARELEDRFGLASVRFDDDVPAAWRPYYRRALENALADLHRVLPALDLRGLRIHFGDTRSASATLAVHEPRTRTIFLPPATSGGTLAHEVAHDLDWQVAVRRYRIRGDYATDRATRLHNDRLAASLRGLTTAALVPPAPGDREPPMHAQRPAEVFARSVDWFVVASLAREGRSNGHLSSVQDDVLTGYGTVTPPDVSGRAGAALIDILDEVAPVYATHRRWFLDQYGPARALTPYDLVRRVLEAPLPEPLGLGPGRTAAIRGVAPSPPGPDGAHGDAPRVEAPEEEPYHEEDEEDADADDASAAPFLAAARQFAAIAEARGAAFDAIDAWICRAPGAAADPALEAARRRLVARAAGARARGVALEVAQLLGDLPARQWVGRQFFGAPWPSAALEGPIVRVLGGLVDAARELDRAELATPASAFRTVAPREQCAAGSFAGVG